MKDLLRSDETVLPKDDAALKELIETSNSEQPANQELDPKVAAFIESQKRNHPRESVKSKIRNIDIPKEYHMGSSASTEAQRFAMAQVVGYNS